MLTSAAGAFDVAEAVADDFISAHYQCKWAASSTRQGVQREGDGEGSWQAGHAACPAAKVVGQKPHTHTLSERVCSLVSALDAALGVH